MIMLILFVFISSAFLMFILYTREICLEIFEVCLALIEENNTVKEQQAFIETPNFFLTQKRPQQNLKHKNEIISLFGASIETQFAFVEFMVSDMLGLWEEFGSVFGSAILVWTLFSVPNYFLALFFLFFTFYESSVPITHFSNFQNTFLIMGQLIFSYQVYSVGDAMENKVRIKQENTELNWIRINCK